MKFHRYISRYVEYRRESPKGEKPLPLVDFYDALVASERKAQHTNTDSVIYQALNTSELMWHLEGRPYYNITPIAIDMFNKISLDVPIEYLRLPYNSITINMPKGFELHGETRSGVDVVIESLMFSPSMKWLAAITSNGNRTQGYMPIPLGNDGTDNKPVTIEQGCALALGWSGHDKLNGLVEKLVRIAYSLCVIASDPETDLLTPDVLANDRYEYDRCFEKGQYDRCKQMIDRANRRGKVGWTVGANIEYTAHARRPYFGIRWKGSGEDKRPCLVPIKGCIVRKKSITDVPTGYLDNSESRKGRISPDTTEGPQIDAQGQ